MFTSHDDGVYSKTQAYNFLKELLGVPKGVLINKNFFSLFFSEFENGKYLIKKAEDVIINIFTEKGIAEMNKMYYLKKQENQIDEANKISEIVITLVKETLAA